jgi:hypothetical protein
MLGWAGGAFLCGRNESGIERYKSLGGACLSFLYEQIGSSEDEKGGRKEPTTLDPGGGE